MMARGVTLAVLLAATFPLRAHAGEAGSRGAIAQVRADAARLLANRVRRFGADPKSLTISDVVIVRDQALLSWNAGKARGVMGLAVQDSRWWDAFDMTTQSGNGCWNTVVAYPLAHVSDPFPSAYAPPAILHSSGTQVLRDAGMAQDLVAAAASHNADARAIDLRSRCNAGAHEAPPDARIHAAGAVVHPMPRAQTAGYDLTISYARNDAGSDARFARIFMRAPTSAEFLPNPVPPRTWGGPTDLGYFDIDVAGAKPVAFAGGTTIDIWTPFVLDDSLRYDLSFVSSDKTYGPYRGTLFDNVLHFELPAFIIAPGNQLEAEISGWY